MLKTVFAGTRYTHDVTATAHAERRSRHSNQSQWRYAQQMRLRGSTLGVISSVHHVLRREPNPVVEVTRDGRCLPDQQCCQVVDLLLYLAARGDAANYFERAFCESEKMAIPVKGGSETAAAHGLELPGGRRMSPSDITG